MQPQPCTLLHRAYAKTHTQRRRGDLLEAVVVQGLDKGTQVGLQPCTLLGAGHGGEVGPAHHTTQHQPPPVPQAPQTRQYQPGPAE